MNVGPTGAPPTWRRFSAVKSHAAKEAGVAKDQGAFRLVKNKVVVLLRSESRRVDAQFPGHAEMNANPIGPGEFEEHLLSPGFGAQEPGACQVAGQGTRIRTPKDALSRVKLHAQNLLPKAGVPLSAIIFDFSELRHGEKMLWPLRCVEARSWRGDTAPWLQRSCVMC